MYICEITENVLLLLIPMELTVIGRCSTHHLYLVRLLGFCSEGRHRLLVYEFMKNGSLNKFLFTSDEQSCREVLYWRYRYNIALGTAKGITYLHEECRDCIVHSDIKPENILLDENYNAKISDFGLARLINTNGQRHRTILSVRGTRGYLLLESLANLLVNIKADVYSYGMVLLEIISGRKNFEVSTETNHKKLSLWAYEEFEKGNIEAILDKRLLRHEVDIEQAIRTIRIGFWCIQGQPSLRTMMGKVVQMLEGISEIRTPPPSKLDQYYRSVLSSPYGVIIPNSDEFICSFISNGSKFLFGFRTKFRRENFLSAIGKLDMIMPEAEPRISSREVLIAEKETSVSYTI
ncbi:G-type lectin S-receptor-like serine/threonine-protein kinase At1g34300 [Olea europaea var. sylvestris]|uniref:G-type lectin S-receptor-like serine/threonine-protein kinase At1g34300 n=1 Tax=Olea europaea var. sylvestris TaxID=158386 RepID=UPI000C1D07AD|nr:G-type lectin S-receptor-like serine/threonine-protein kinase At1g34300 [Olea europaea var. sylvestris]